MFRFGGLERLQADKNILIPTFGDFGNGSAAVADLVKPFRLELGENLEPNLSCTPCTTRRVGRRI